MPRKLCEYSTECVEPADYYIMMPGPDEEFTQSCTNHVQELFRVNPGRIILVNL